MKFDSKYFGPQEVTSADALYVGSRYSEIRDVLFKNAYYMNWGTDGEPPLPVYEVNLRRVLSGMFSIYRRSRFLQASGRVLDARSDLRWGADGRGYRRLLHPNGVCLFGKWIIDQPTEYSGYFRQGSEALVVGRYSSCCTETRRGYCRSLSLVGKLFPTQDPQHTELLRTANFITQEDLGGTRTEFMNDCILRNAPDTTPWRRGLGFPILLLTGLTFMRVDRQVTIRQLYPIAELGKPAAEPTFAPEFMQLRVAPDSLRVPGDQLDFRDEVLAQIYDKNDPAPKRKLVFTIEVTDDGITRGVLRQRRFFPSGWRPIGRIEFDEAVASYNGDFVIHFHHPPWRNDPNDPSTQVRK